MGEKTAPVERSYGENNVLVEKSDPGTGERACLQRFAPDGEPVRWVVVTATTPADEWVDRWHGHGSGNLGIVAVGDAMRSAAARATCPTSPGDSVHVSPDPSPVHVSPVPSVTDLPGIGNAIDGYLAAWDGDDARIAVCFHALSTLLDHADRVRVLRFLAGVGTRVAGAGAVGHYHVDPDGCDRRTLARLESLFPAATEA